jgi:hypothetical protein
VTFAGRFFGVFLAGEVETTPAAGVELAAICAADVPRAGTGLETPTSADFEDCFEHALIASISPRITKLVIIASFCWSDQDESVVPEIVWVAEVFVVC